MSQPHPLYRVGPAEFDSDPGRLQIAHAGLASATSANGTEREGATLALDRVGNGGLSVLAVVGIIVLIPLIPPGQDLAEPLAAESEQAQQVAPTGRWVQPPRTLVSARRRSIERRRQQASRACSATKTAKKSGSG